MNVCPFCSLILGWPLFTLFHMSTKTSPKISESNAQVIKSVCLMLNLCILVLIVVDDINKLRCLKAKTTHFWTRYHFFFSVTYKWETEIKSMFKVYGNEVQHQLHTSGIKKKCILVCKQGISYFRQKFLWNDAMNEIALLFVMLLLFCYL